MKIKKYLSIILSIAMIFVLGSTAAFAAGSDGQIGSIMIANPQDGETYTAYKIFDVTYDDNGHYSYTIKGDSPWYNTVNAYANNTSNGITLTAVAGTAAPVVYVVTATENAFSAPGFAQVLKAALYNTTSPVVDSNAVTLTNGSATGLALGYWFVSTTSGSLCNLTTTNPSQTIYDKNAKPTIDKTVDDEDLTVYVGQDLTYTLTVTTPATVEGYSRYTYEVGDTMDEGLNFLAIESVKIGNDTLNLDDLDDIFTYLHSGINATADAGTPSNGFKLSADLAEKDENEDLIYAAYLGKKIEIKYQAVVTEHAVTADKETNTAYLTYSKNPYDYTDTDKIEKKIDVYSANIDIEKVDANKTATKLSDAKFVLYKMDGNTKKYYKYNVVSEGNDSVEWKALPAGSADVSAALKADSTFCTVRTTGTDGKIDDIFAGLDAGTYYLEEIAAPAGYNLPKDAFTVVITKNNTDPVTITATIDKGTITVEQTDMKAKATITNGSGSILPSTGGIGTTIFYVLGIILVLGAAILLITRKRMSASK